MAITLFNPTGSPVVYTTDGRIVAGTERVEVDQLDEAGERAVARGYLVEESEKNSATAEGEPAAAPDGEPEEVRPSKRSSRSRKNEESGQESDAAPGESAEAKGD